MTEPIDIHDPIHELCTRLGLKPENVAKIIFQPNRVTATIYKTDENGSKYLEADLTGREEVATEVQTFAVTT